MANQLKVTVRNAPLNNTNFRIGNGVSADFNNDGYADIIFATDISSTRNGYKSPVAIFTYNNTTQSFDPFKITIDGVSNTWPEVIFGRDIAISDINKDGIADFIVFDQNENSEPPYTFGPFDGAYQYAYISKGIGNYNKVDLGIGIANVHGYAIINSSDGKFRVAANTPWTRLNPSNFSISTYNDKTGLFESSLFSNGDSFYSSAGVSESEYFFTTGIDVNNDGNTDLIGFTSPGNISAIYLNNGFGGFAFSKTIDMGLKGRFASEGGWGIGEVVEEVSIGDFNNDGYDDFVVLAVDRRGWPNQTEFKTIRVLINDQNGGFVDQTTTWIGDRFQNADLGYGYIDTMDINNDGKSDLIWNHMTTKSWIPNVSHFVIDVMLSTGSAFEVFTLGSEISSPSWDKSKSSIGGRVIPISDNQVVMSTDWSKSFNSVTTFSYENLIEGTPQNDLLVNLPGNNQINGGAGIDTLVVSGLPSQYSFSGSTLTGADGTLIGVDGVDTLTSIEFIRFGSSLGNDLFVSDLMPSQLVDPDGNGPQLSQAKELLQGISALYMAVFSRAPEQSGLLYWMSQANKSANVFESIANGFTQHPVFTEVYGGLDNSAFVNALYVNILGGPGDVGGVNYWVNELSVKTRAQVLSSLVQSALEIDLTVGAAALGLTDIELTAAEARQNRIINKSKVGVSFAELLGSASNLANDTNPSTLSGLQADPAFRASVEAIRNVTDNKATLDNAIANLSAAVASGNPIAFLANANTNSASSNSFVSASATDAAKSLDTLFESSFDDAIAFSGVTIVGSVDIG